MNPIIYFDFDGTLVDSMDLCLKQVSRALAACGYPPADESLLRACNGPTYMEAAALLGIPEHDRERFCRVRGEIEVNIIGQTQKLFPGVTEMLQSLVGRAALGIVSNGLEDYLFTSLDKFGLRGLFDFIQPLIPGQSKAETLKQLIRQQKPARALMVGDRAGDFEAGNHAGIPTVAACYGFGNEEEYALAQVRMDSVAALQAYLVNWTASA